MWVTQGCEPTIPQRVKFEDGEYVSVMLPSLQRLEQIVNFERYTFPNLEHHAKRGPEASVAWMWKIAKSVRANYLRRTKAERARNVAFDDSVGDGGHARRPKQDGWKELDRAPALASLALADRPESVRAKKGQKGDAPADPPISRNKIYRSYAKPSRALNKPIRAAGEAPSARVIRERYVAALESIPRSFRDAWILCRDDGFLNSAEAERLLSGPRKPGFETKMHWRTARAALKLRDEREDHKLLDAEAAVFLGVKKPATTEAENKLRECLADLDPLLSSREPAPRWPKEFLAGSGRKSSAWKGAGKIPAGKGKGSRSMHRVTKGSATSASQSKPAR